MVVGAEEREQAVVAAGDLVGVVGDVAREVGVGAVALLDDAVLVVGALVPRDEEQRAVLPHEVAALLELGERDGDEPPAVERLLAEPDVERDVEVREGLLDAAEACRDPGSPRSIQLDAGPRERVPVAVERRRVDLPEAARELADVRRPVAPLGRGSPLGRREDALGEEPHLVAEVVDVVLARDAVARRLEQARDGVAEDGAAGVADVQRDRSGWR